MSDSIALCITACQPDDLYHNCWMAFKLQDGTTDHVRYPSKRACVEHQANEFHYLYFSFRRAMAGAKPLECQLFLDLHRHAYEQGFRLADPDAPELITPLAVGQGRWPMLGLAVFPAHFLTMMRSSVMTDVPTLNAYRARSLSAHLVKITIQASMSHCLGRQVAVKHG